MTLIEDLVEAALKENARAVDQEYGPELRDVLGRMESWDATGELAPADRDGEGYLTGLKEKKHDG